MIEVNNTGSYCNACRSKDTNDPKEIRFGIQIMTCFTLCKDCRIELMRLLKQEDK